MSILTTLKSNNRMKAVIRASVLALAVLVVSFLVALVNASQCSEILAFSSSLRIIGLGFALAIITYLFFRYSSSERLDGTAKKIDSTFSGKNRLEAAVELRVTDNPLKNSQLQETETYFNDKKIKNLFSIVCFLSLLIFFMLMNNSYFLFIQHQVSSGAEDLLRTATLKKKQERIKSKPKKDFAELVITAPESEKRAKPMDEIAWDGTGRASKGFEKIFLSISVNGVFKKNVPVEKDQIQKLSSKVKTIAKVDTDKPSESKESVPDKLSLQGEFYLDELDVVPFDVVSYHLLGYSNMNDIKGVKVISVPQFIEVRPFREDALFSKIDGMGMDEEMKEKIKNILALLNKFLRFQISLNKAVFTVRSSGLDMDNQLLLEQIKMLTTDQFSLKKELHVMLENIPPELISANMMDYLRFAHDEMEKAGKTLEKLK